VTTGTTLSPTFTLLYRYGTVRYGTVRYGTVMKIPVPVSVSGSAYRIKVMVTQKIVSKRS
jgi:hypothetical protein